MNGQERINFKDMIRKLVQLIKTIVTFSLNACKCNPKREKAAWIIHEWTDNEIRFPENMPYVISGKETPAENCEEIFLKEINSTRTLFLKIKFYSIINKVKRVFLKSDFYVFCLTFFSAFYDFNFYLFFSKELQNLKLKFQSDSVYLIFRWNRSNKLQTPIPDTYLSPA